MDKITEEEYLKNRKTVKRLNIDHVFYEDSDINNNEKERVSKNYVVTGGSKYVNYFTMLKILDTIIPSTHDDESFESKYIYDKKSNDYKMVDSWRPDIGKNDILNLVKKIYSKKYHNDNNNIRVSFVIECMHREKFEDLETLEEYTDRITIETKALKEKEINKQKILKEKELENQKELDILNKYAKKYKFKIPDNLKLVSKNNG